MNSWIKPHRIALLFLGLGLVFYVAISMQWAWLPKYSGLILHGIWMTIVLLVSTCILGFLMAVPLGLFQVTGPKPLALLCRGFCTAIRGTPLLLQLWLIYFGLGSLFPQFPEIRDSFLWPYLRQAWPYALLSLTLSFAGYEGEVMRGAFAGVPSGELEAARAYGMKRFTALRRIWLPRAVLRALPTLNGEVVLQLKSTPLVATITVVEAYAVTSKIRQETFIIYEPLLLVSLIYMCLTAISVVIFSYFENKMPTRDV
jgi:polar amino acid transport system permease protein